MKRAEHLLNKFISLPESSSFFNTEPANVKPMNHIQDTAIHAAVNKI